MKKVNKKSTYKIQINMDSFIQRVSNQIALLEDDYPNQIIKADVPEAMKRGIAASDAIKNAASNALPKTGLTTDLSKAFSDTSKRDFKTSSYSKKFFFTNLTAIGNQVYFLYFISSELSAGNTTLTSSFIHDLSNYFPIVEVKQEQLEEVHQVPMYKFLTENTEIQKDIVLLPNVGEGYYYRIDPTLYMGIGTKGNYQDFISKVNVGKADGSAALSEYARNAYPAIKDAVLSTLRNNSLYSVLSKHPLFLDILNNSYVLQDSVRAALVDYLNIFPLLSISSTGKRLPEAMIGWLNDPHTKFYSDIQYSPTEQIKIPPFAKDTLITNLEKVKSMSLSLRKLLNDSLHLQEIVAHLHKVGSKTVVASLQSIFNRGALTIASIKKKLLEGFLTSTGSEEEIAQFLINGTLAPSTGSDKTSYLRIIVNPTKNIDKFALFLEASVFQTPEKLSLNEGPDATEANIRPDTVSRLNIRSYEPHSANIGLDIPISLHKWVIAAMKSRGVMKIDGDSYYAFLTTIITEKSAAAVGGTSGREYLHALIKAAFNDDPKKLDFSKVINKVNVLPPEYLLKYSSIKLLSKNSNELLKEFITKNSAKYKEFSTIDSFTTATKVHVSSGGPRPIFVSPTGFTPAALNSFNFNGNTDGVIDSDFEEFIVKHTEYVTCEDIANKLKTMVEPPSKLLSDCFANAVLGYYGNDSKLFLESAFATQGSKMSLIVFAQDLSNSRENAIKFTLKTAYA